MNALYQALKALDPHTFELLIVHLLKAQYPGVEIKHINGSSGDEGVDVISGQLDEHPTIWQCKSFPGGIKDSQKGQIRESLQKSIKYFTPKRWVLCLSVDMDVSSWRWFQRLGQSRAEATQVELLQASDIVQQLLYRHTIREQLFPATILDVAAIREGLAATKAFKTEDLAALNEQNVSIYLARLQGHDARFAYHATFTRDQELPPPSPGALLSVISGGTMLQVFPRDREAIKARPPQVKFTVRDTGVDKFLENLRTGRPQTFTSQELASITSDFEFLMPRERSGMTLNLMASSSIEAIPLRLIFGKGDQAVTYDYVPFRRARSGSEEILFESAAPLPFRISLLINTNGTSNVSFAECSGGFTVKETQKQAHAIDVAANTGGIDFYSLVSGKLFVRARLEGTISESVRDFYKFLNDAASIVDAYSVNLTVPERITEADCRSLRLLHDLVTGITYSGGEVVAELVKSLQIDDGILPTLERDCAFRLTLPEYPEEIAVFGIRVMTGPIRCDISQGRLRDPQTVRRFLEDAPIGSAMKVSIETLGTVTLVRLTPQT